MCPGLEVENQLLIRRLSGLERDLRRLRGSTMHGFMGVSKDIVDLNRAVAELRTKQKG